MSGTKPPIPFQPGSKFTKTVSAENWARKPASLSCKLAAAAAMSSATTKRPAKRTARKIPAERKNPMLDSVRSRMTLWYSGLLGLFLVLLAGLTYFLYWHNSLQSTDSNLLELSETYVTTFNAEIKDATGDDPRKEAARVAMIEHRFRDVVFALVDDHGQVLLSSLDLPAIRGGREL